MNVKARRLHLRAFTFNPTEGSPSGLPSRNITRFYDSRKRLLRSKNASGLDNMAGWPPVSNK